MKPKAYKYYKKCFDQVFSMTQITLHGFYSYYYLLDMSRGVETITNFKTSKVFSLMCERNLLKFPYYASEMRKNLEKSFKFGKAWCRFRPTFLSTLFIFFAAGSIEVFTWAKGVFFRLYRRLHCWYHSEKYESRQMRIQIKTERIDSRTVVHTILLDGVTYYHISEPLCKCMYRRKQKLLNRSLE